MTTAFKTCDTSAFDTAKVPTDHPTSPEPAIPEIPFKNETVAYFDMSDTDSIIIGAPTFVAQINDLSGNGNDLFEAFAEGGPTTGGTQNGLNVTTWGSFTLLLNSAVTNFSAPSVTILALANAQKSAVGDIVMLSDAAVNARLLLQESPTVTLMKKEKTTPFGSAIDVQGVGYNPTWNMHVGINTATPSPRVKAANADNVTAGIGEFMPPFTITNMEVGNSSLPSQSMVGDIAEIAIWPRELTAGELTQVKDFFQNKWAVSL